MIELKRIYEDLSHVELFINGVSQGIFVTPKMAQKYIDKNVYISHKSDIVNSESSGANQKNDEPILVKRRGRPKKVSNDRAPIL